MEKLGNAYLGADFSISSTLLLIVLFSSLIYYRKKIFFFLYKNENLDIFIKNLQTYLATTYPDFKFDFLFIHGMNEKNPDAKKYEILDTLITQYTNKPYKPKVLNAYQSTFWDSYAFFAKPDGDKLPNDWGKRQSAILDRDKQQCQRCSKKVNLRNSDILFIKPINDGGTYYLENMVLVCNDCKLIENQKTNKSIDLHTLEIKEKLYTFVH